MLTVWSSILLGTVPFYETDWRLPVMTVLTGTSVAHHYLLTLQRRPSWQPIVATIDRAVAHATAVFGCVEATRVPWSPETLPVMLGFWMCFLWVVFVFYVVRFSDPSVRPATSRRWHASIHGATALSAIFLHYAQNGCWPLLPMLQALLSDRL
jgi:hypothetical protein